jgi:hypothetical protein
MSLRSTMAAGLMLLAVVLPAPAQTALEWKFKEGDKFYIEAVTTTTQKIGFGDKTTTSDSTYTMVSRFEVKKADAGAYTLEQTIEGVRVKSSKADDSIVAIQSRFANLLKGATFKFTINSLGKITSAGLDGYDDLVKKLGGGNDKGENSVRESIPEDGFKDDLLGIFGFLPDKATPPKGFIWMRKESFPFRQWGKLTGQTTYTYQGPGKDGEQIDVSQKLTYQLPPADTAPGVKVVKGGLKVTAPTGTIVVDPAAGRLVGSKQVVQVTGKLTTTTADTPPKEITFDVDETTTRTVRRVEENPLK